MVLTDIKLPTNYHNNIAVHPDSITDNITIKNLDNGEVITYSLVLIRGKAPSSCSYINIHGTHKNIVNKWPIIAGEFRILVDLVRGVNKLELEANGVTKQLVLIHEPRPTRLRVAPVYVICAGHDGYFQGPIGEDRSPESAATRIGLGARLLQSLTAEKMKETGHGRKTFQLERDLDGPECLVMHSTLHVDSARAMNQRELWEFIGRELMTGPLASKDRKYLAFLSCTKYRGAPSPRTHESTLASTQGHAALGGGGLALFGSACLHTWPTCLSQVLNKFLDTAMIDTDQLMDDSNYRGTHGGCLATTLGSVLHELGHTFDLGHTREGIMGRGFNYVDHVFIGNDVINNNNNNKNNSNNNNNNNNIRRDPQHTTITLSKPLSVTVSIDHNGVTSKRGRLMSETTTRVNDNFIEKNLIGRMSAPASPVMHKSFLNSVNIDIDIETASYDKIFWGPSCGMILAHHRWFNNTFDNNNHIHRNNHQIEYNMKRNVVKSTHGIRVIELRESANGMVVNYRQFPGSRPPTEALVPLPSPFYCYISLILFAEDSAGNILKTSLPTAF